MCTICFRICAQKLKTVFLGLNLFAFKQSSPLAVEQNCAKIVQIVQNCAFAETADELWWVEVEIFLFHLWFFLALFIKYAVRCRGMMLHCSMRYRSNMLRLNILHKPVPHCIQHCAGIVQNCSMEDQGSRC